MTCFLDTLLLIIGFFAAFAYLVAFIGGFLDGASGRLNYDTNGTRLFFTYHYGVKIGNWLMTERNRESK